MKASNPRKRLAITDLERQNIRHRYASHPSTQPALIAWYAAQSQGRDLTQGQISSILSEKYQYLDSDTRKKTLQLFTSLGEDGGRISVIKALEQIGKDISQEKRAKSIQCSSDSWLP